MEKLDKRALHWLKSVVGQLRSQGLSQAEALKEAHKKAVDIAYYREVYSGNDKVEVVDARPYYQVMELLEGEEQGG